MTIYQMFELCQVEVPQASQTMIVEQLNERIKEFCHRTEIYKLQGNITIVANTVEYTLLTEFPLIDGEMVKEIIFKDTNGENVTSQYQLKFDILNGKIRFYSSLGGNISAIPSKINSISVYYVAVPITKTIGDTLTEIDSQFHENVRSGASEVLYKLYPTIEKKSADGITSFTKDLGMIQYSFNHFEKGILRGTRFANSYAQTPKQIFNEGF